MFLEIDDINFISQPPALESNVNIGPMSVRVGKGVVHTLTSAVSSFTQVINSSKQCFEIYWLSKAFKRIKGMTIREEVQKEPLLLGQTLLFCLILWKQ